MDKKIILELIKKDINELQLLTEAMTKNPDHDNILLEVSIGRTQTLLSQLDLLKSIHGESKPANEQATSAIIEDTPEIDTKVEPKNVSEDVTQTDNKEPELSENNPIKSTEIINNTIPDEPDNPKNETIDDFTVEAPEITNKEEDIQAPPISEQKTESNATASTEEKEENKEEEKEEISEDSDEKKPQVFGEQFSKEPSLNERFSDLQKTRAAVIGHPVHSLRKAIGLNDRFMFTRELFENNSDKFDETINALDKAENIVDAVEYLEQNFKWKKNDASLKFMELVKRRHGNTFAN
ncbi:MAG TPA: hypothetical protein PLS94_11150 [Prolixibacteraceae bacterium]|nr:hypothetical protein [Prolixibacteraceae bacterium]